MTHVFALRSQYRLPIFDTCLIIPVRFISFNNPYYMHSILLDIEEPCFVPLSHPLLLQRLDTHARKSQRIIQYATSQWV